MSESLSSSVPPVEIPGTVVAEVSHASLVSHGSTNQDAVESAVEVARVPANPPTGVLVDSPSVEPAPAVAPSESASAVGPEIAATLAGADAPTTDEPQRETGRRTGMAVNGRPVTELPAPPATPVWPEFVRDAPGAPATPNGAAAVDESYVPDEDFDATDLIQVNRELNRARARIFRCSQTLKRVQRALAEAQVDYDRQMRRALVSQSGGTAESRRALAEIACEEFENRVVIGKQVVEEWRRRCNDARDDLKALENISHNVRASLDIR